MNNSGPDHQEEMEKGTQFMGEAPEFILDLTHCSDTQSRCQGSSGKYFLDTGEDGPKRREQMGSCQHCEREGRRPSNGGTVKPTLAHPFCGPITKELGETDRRKGEVTLYPIVFSTV